MILVLPWENPYKQQQIHGGVVGTTRQEDGPWKLLDMLVSSAYAKPCSA
jgi:hypothetical protein